MNAFTSPGFLKKDAYQLVRALVVAKASNPDLFGQLLEGLHALLDQEMVMPIRVPPPLLPCAQGRAQMAQEVLTLLDNVDHYREELGKIDRKIVAPQIKPTSEPVKWT